MLSAVNLCDQLLKSIKSDFSVAFSIALTKRSPITLIISNIIFILPDVKIGVSLTRLSFDSRVRMLEIIKQHFKEILRKKISIYQFV